MYGASRSIRLFSQSNSKRKEGLVRTSPQFANLVKSHDEDDEVLPQKRSRIPCEKTQEAVSFLIRVEARNAKRIFSPYDPTRRTSVRLHSRRPVRPLVCPADPDRAHHRPWPGSRRRAGFHLRAVTELRMHRWAPIVIDNSQI